jgi:hypothetical protein
VKESHVKAVNVVLLQEEIRFPNKKSLCRQRCMEEKEKLKLNVTDEELDILFRTNYAFHKYSKGILITSYAKAF